MLDVVAFFVLEPVDVAPPITMTDCDVWEAVDCEILLVDAAVPFGDAVEDDVDVKVFCAL